MKRAKKYARIRPKKDLHQRFHTAKITVFYLVLLVTAFLSLLLPLRPSYSEFEKRTLTKFPSFSLESLWSGDYFSQIDLWFSDTFPFRDAFISANSYLKNLYGIQPVQVSGNLEEGDTIPTAPMTPSESADSNSSPSSTQDVSSESTVSSDISSSSAENSVVENTSSETSSSEESSEELPPEKDVSNEVTQSLGAVLIVGDAGYEYYNFSQSVADQYITLINRAAQELSGKASVYDMIVPTSMDILLPESFRAGINTSSQKDAIHYFYSSFSDSVHTISIYDTLRVHSDEYIYFRTDHHWTALGAYYAYVPFIEATGRTPLELSDFETREFDGFLGAFYSDTKKNPALAQNPDTVTAYIPPANASLTFTDQSGNQRNWPIISDVSGWASSSKYSTFIGGDNPYTIIQNSDLTDGSSCLVIKESFGNAFVPFLVSHYQTVHVIDYRYWSGNIPDFVTKNGIQDVLFLNNISATRNSSLVGKMDQLV